MKLELSSQLPEPQAFAGCELRYEMELQNLSATGAQWRARPVVCFVYGVQCCYDLM